MVLSALSHALGTLVMMIMLTPPLECTAQPVLLVHPPGGDLNAQRGVSMAWNIGSCEDLGPLVRTVKNGGMVQVLNITGALACEEFTVRGQHAYWLRFSRYAAQLVTLQLLVNHRRFYRAVTLSRSR